MGSVLALGGQFNEQRAWMGRASRSVRQMVCLCLSPFSDFQRIKFATKWATGTIGDHRPVRGFVVLGSKH